MAHKKAKDGGSHQDMWAIEPEKLVIDTDESSDMFDERVKLAVSEDLVASILFAPNGEAPQGVLVPIACFRDPETSKIHVVNGRQRVRACIEANRRLKKQGLPPLRIRWYPANRGTKARMATMISANEGDQKDSPLVKAKKVVRLKERGFGDEEIGQMLCVSAATVKNMIALLDAPAAVRKAVEAEKISASDGYQLAKLEPEEAKKRLEKLQAEAPRTPGKKRSKNAKKAREIVTGKKIETPSAPVTEAISTRMENRIAKQIAAWVRAEWNENNWAGSPAQMADRIEAGEWRDGKEVAAE
ncbi:MAG: ParB/RepB/Spo0J family partition protein [Acidiferrobacteraceae bacterium]